MERRRLAGPGESPKPRDASRAERRPQPGRR